MPHVSVITPAWNAAEFLAGTIESVRAQTVTDWELIVVDDGSTDGTAALVQRYAEIDPRVRLLQQQNSGPSAARNTAMRSATGQFFAFLDSDDRWHPRYLRAQLDVFALHPDTGLVTGNGWFDGGPFDGAPTRPLATGYPELPLPVLIAQESSVFIMTVFRRAVFDTIGGFDERQWTSEDYDFWLRAAMAGFKFRRNPEPLGWYRVRGNSLSRNRQRMLAGLLQTFTKARARCEGEPRRLIERQIARFESELLLEEAKTAIERSDFAAAAGKLRTLHARTGSRVVSAFTWLLTHAPAAAALAYRLRSWRPALLRSTPSTPAIAGDAR
jgi:glycosyltransferase involved in cell wall biosynthesis